MELSSDLISQFVKNTRDNDKTKEGATVNGTIVEYDNKMYVRIDGSDLLTPYTTTVSVKPGQRVTIDIKDHTATITGNRTDPSASSSGLKEVRDGVLEVNTLLADKVSTKDLEAERARIGELEADNVTVKGRLTASEARIGTLEAENVTVTGKLTAQDAEIENLKATKLDADVAKITYATIEDLTATNADIHDLHADYADFNQATAQKLTAIDATITNLGSTYANIDFSNIGKAAIEYFYAQSGLIKDVVVGDGTITGELVGVTIKGDLIEGNTIKAEKLVIKGSDGLYYKLNTDGVTTEAEQTDQNSLNGSVIMAKSITATKIAVDDLVAFDATIGGFNITSDAIYSGVKDSPTNTTRGIYMDNKGQLAVGDSSNYLRYYKDQNGVYKLEISAKSITMSTGGSTIEDEISNIKDEMNTIKDEVTTVLRLESSKGAVFKSDQISTVLSAVIYRGNQRITDMQTLKTAMGDSAYLEWSWQRLNDEQYWVVSSDDPRIGNEGFTFTLSPNDVDTKVTFMCTLNS